MSWGRLVGGVGEMQGGGGLADISGGALTWEENTREWLNILLTTICDI